MGWKVCMIGKKRILRVLLGDKFFGMPIITQILSNQLPYRPHEDHQSTENLFPFSGDVLVAPLQGLEVEGQEGFFIVLDHGFCEFVLDLFQTQGI